MSGRTKFPVVWRRRTAAPQAGAASSSDGGSSTARRVRVRKHTSAGEAPAAAGGVESDYSDSADRVQSIYDVPAAIDTQQAAQLPRWAHACERLVLVSLAAGLAAHVYLTYAHALVLQKQ